MDNKIDVLLLRFFRTFSLIGLTLLFIPEFSTAESVHLRGPVISVGLSGVTLGDLFQPLPPEKAEITIGKAPGIGKIETYSVQRLAEIASMHDLQVEDMSALTLKPKTTSWGGDAIIDLVRSAHTNWVINQSDPQNFPEKYEFILKKKSGFEVPEGQKLIPEITDYSYQTASKNFTARLKFSLDGETLPSAQPIKDYAVEGFAYPLLEIPALKTPLMAGSLITPDDIEPLYLRQDRLLPYMETQMTALMGLETATSIPAHQPISKKNVKQPRLVHKNDMVDVLLSDGAIQLSVQGKALQDGSKGELISVVNISSKKVIQGEVVGANQIKITTTGRT